jgi:hypothetical protein
MQELVSAERRDDPLAVLSARERDVLAFTVGCGRWSPSWRPADWIHRVAVAVAGGQGADGVGR